MPNTCSVYGCHARGGRDVGVSFYLIPAVIINQGDATRELCSRRLRALTGKIGIRPSIHACVPATLFQVLLLFDFLVCIINI